jgi:4-amino-4-deoxy-L-arabinose transferase-like glycosyltransferase
MKALGFNLDFIVIALVIASFSFVASQRLATVPVPEGDEAYMMQVTYEMLYRHKVAVPMMRYLGGNIENAWHSRTPIYFLLMIGFHKLAGFGLLQARIFNLLTAAATLVMVYLAGRRRFDWRVGLVAVLLLTADVSFLERSRLLRNDFAGAFFALLAYYLYELAEDKKSARLYITSGLATGAGVMCHTNIMYMFGAIALLILLRTGWRAFTTSKLYLYAASALAVMAYEIIYALVDYKNFLLQNSGDKAHFTALSPPGLWENFLHEPLRYQSWYGGGETYPISNVPVTLLHLFQLLTVIALLYLIGLAVWRAKQGKALEDARVRLLVVALVAILFFAFISSPRRKSLLYMVHLSSWFALCSGVFGRDVLERFGRLRYDSRKRSRLLYKAVLALLSLGVIGYALMFVRQNRTFIRQVRNPDLATFDDFAVTLRRIIPKGVCPLSVTRPAIWLVFPEQDRCYATIEGRMEYRNDLDVHEYALLVPSHKADAWLGDSAGKFHLLGEMENTPYGDIEIYYTGTNPQYLALAPQRYRFFGVRRGFVNEEQVANAREVWSPQPRDLARALGAVAEMQPAGLTIQPPPNNNVDRGLIALADIDLKPDAVYQLQARGRSSGQWELVVVDERTGVWIDQCKIAEGEEAENVESIFKAGGASKIKLALRSLGKPSAAAPITISSISLREITLLPADNSDGNYR